MANDKHQKQDDFFNRFMFGNKHEKQETVEPKNTIEKYMENVDVELLVENFDLLMSSVKQIKPIINKVSPYFMQFIKKQ